MKGQKAREQHGAKVGQQINVKVAESRHCGRLRLPSPLPAIRMTPAMRRATRCKGQANAGGGSAGGGQIRGFRGSRVPQTKNN